MKALISLRVEVSKECTWDDLQSWAQFNTVGGLLAPTNTLYDTPWDPEFNGADFDD